MWRINLVKNELSLTPEAAADINAIPDDSFVAEDGKLYFDPDHYEHMDYVWNDEVLEVIAKHKLSGEILFSSSEGDNRNTGWGYRFDEGIVTELTRNSAREYVPDGDPSLSVVPAAQEDGVEVTDLVDAKAGDYVAVGFIFMGLTSWERGQVGDVLPDGTIVVDGKEFSAPDYRHRSEGFGGMPGSTSILKVLSDPAVDLEEDYA